MTTLSNANMAGQRVIARSGAAYTVDSNGAVVVTVAEDKQTFYLLGFVETGTGAIGATGATGAAGPTGSTGATAAVQVFYGTTSSTPNAFAATIAGATPLQVGSVFNIVFVHAPTDAATFNVNGTGGHPIVLATGAAISSQQGVDGQMVEMVWNGASFVYPVQPNNS